MEEIETTSAPERAPSDGQPDVAAAPSSEPQTFEAMALRPELMRAVEEMGYAVPMPVQAATWLPIIAGKDLLVQSRTGSGKTAAFGLPFAQGLVDGGKREVQALCLSPTRELALQIANECERLCKYLDITVAPVYGGAPMGKQIELLGAGAQVVAGTPGRVLDHLRRGTLRLDGLKVLVLDECDEMLSMGFAEEIQDIIQRCPTDRQTLLFSATIPEDIERISRKYMRDPQKITLSADFIGVHEIQHAYYMVKGMGRSRDLVRILEIEKPDSAIIFCNTRDETSTVAEFLRKSGLDAEAISSDLTQKDRERVMGRMRLGNLHYLVATDIAARGIDISDLSHVINYTFPESAEVYVHRTGRTGRAGKSGVAISLIAPRELGNFYYLKLTYKIKPEERNLPSEEDVAKGREQVRHDDLRRELAAKDVSAEWRSLARRVIAAQDSEAVVAALLCSWVETKSAGGPAILAAPASIGTPAAEGTQAEEAQRPAPRERERGGRERGRRRERGDDRTRAGAAQRNERRPPPTPAVPAPPIIAPQAGKEFWEAWVDSQSGAPASGVTSPESKATEASDSVNAPTAAAGQRRERTRRETPPVEAGTVRLYLNLGRRDGVSSEELTALLSEKQVGYRSFDLRGSHTYLVVDEAHADAGIAALTGQTFRDRELRCERSHR